MKFIFVRISIRISIVHKKVEMCAEELMKNYRKMYIFYQIRTIIVNKERNYSE